MTAAAIGFAIDFLRWLLDSDRPPVLRAKRDKAVRGEVDEAINCLRRAERYLEDEEAAGRAA